MKEEIFIEGVDVDEFVTELENDLINDPDYKESIMKVGARTLASMMVVDGVGVDGFSIERKVVRGDGAEFTIEVRKV